MPYPSMTTNVPSIAARISGMRSTSWIRNRSASLMAAQSTEAVAPHPSLLFHDRRGSDHSSGAIAATNLATPSAEPRGGPRRRTVADRSPPSRRSPGKTASSPTSARPTGSRTSSPRWFEGCTIAPGFVDCHTHLPFAGWRADEFEARLSRVSYRELHGEGGIYRSARMLAEASDDEVARVLPFARAGDGRPRHDGPRAQDRLRPLRRGRAPSGAPRPQARAGGAAGRCSVTLLACHAVPEGCSAPTGSERCATS